MERHAIPVLCVDDEPQILAGLSLQLRHGFEVQRATNGTAALELLRSRTPFAVILSDMRMPGMNGAEFLAKAREIAPESTRMLLTGHADLEMAIAAVNQGQIFRFLTKPCPPEVLLRAFQAAAEQYRLVTAQRVLLEETLIGAIRTLTEILALASPLVFGRAVRIRDLAKGLAGRLEVGWSWRLEAAAMLSQLAALTVPPELAQRQLEGQECSAEERRMLARLPEVTQSLLGHIPRLEEVCEILKRSAHPRRPEPAPVHASPGPAFEAEILRVAVEFDDLISGGGETAVSVATLRGRPGRYDLRVLAALEELKGGGGAELEVREIPLRLLSPGMVFTEDVLNNLGVLVVAKGVPVSASFLERLRNYGHGYVKEPLRVILPARGPGR